MGMFDKTPKYDIDLEEFETSEPNHAKIFNKRIEKIIQSLGWIKENALTKAHVVKSTEIQEDGCLMDGKTLSTHLKSLVSSWEKRLTEGLREKVDSIDGKGLSENDFTNTLKEKLDGISEAANKYIHPEHTKYASGLYKVEVDEEGHIVSAALVTKEDITELGIPGQDTNTTYGLVSIEAAGLAPKRTGTTTKFLRDDGIWAVPPDTDTTYGVVSIESAGLAPKRTGTTTKYLRDDGIWAVPPDTTYDIVSTNEAGLVPKRGGSTKKYLRDDGIWEVPPNTEYGTGNEEEEGIGKLYSKIGENTDGSMTQKAISKEFTQLNGKSYADGYIFVELGAVPNKNVKNIDVIGIPSNAKHVWIDAAWAKKSTSGLIIPLPYVDTTSTTDCIRIVLYTGRIQISTAGDWSYYNAWAVVAYKL